MINDNDLKYKGQSPKSIHVLAILMKFLRHNILLTVILRCFQDNLSSLGVNELLYLAIKFLNSSSKKGVYFIIDLSGISSNKSRLIW